MDILQKILNYESQIFDEFLVKRQLMLSHLKKANLSSLDKNQLNVFAHDMKSIIDPIKTSISEIDYYFTNTDFKKTDNLKKLNQLQTLSMLYILLNQSETEDTDAPESESESVSESEEFSSSSSEV